jgi:hypothetical protein
MLLNPHIGCRAKFINFWHSFEKNIKLSFFCGLSGQNGGLLPVASAPECPPFSITGKKEKPH